MTDRIYYNDSLHKAVKNLEDKLKEENKETKTGINRLVINRIIERQIFDNIHLLQAWNSDIFSHSKKQTKETIDKLNMDKVIKQINVLLKQYREFKINEEVFLDTSYKLIADIYLKHNRDASSIRPLTKEIEDAQNNNIRGLHQTLAIERMEKTKRYKVQKNKNLLECTLGLNSLNFDLSDFDELI